MADEVDVRELRGLQPAAEPVDEAVGAEVAPEGRQVQQMDAPMLREPAGHRRPPAPGPRQAVHQHDGRAVAQHPPAERRPVDLELEELH